MPHTAASSTSKAFSTRWGAVVAHELRNPLQPLRGFVTLMRLRGLGDGELGRSLDAADRQLDLLQRLIDDLDRFDAQGWQSKALENRRLSLRDLLEQSLEAVGPVLAARQHTLHVAIEPGEHWVLADADRLLQVLANLLSNAAKFTPHGGEIEVALYRDADETVLQIRDSGRGLAADEATRIFQPFERGQAAEGVAGSGLGLAVVRWLVELHGGTVQAGQRPGGTGACFTVRLPGG